MITHASHYAHFSVHEFSSTDHAIKFFDAICSQDLEVCILYEDGSETQVEHAKEIREYGMSNGNIVLGVPLLERELLVENPTREQFVKMISTMATMLPHAISAGHLNMRYGALAACKNDICNTPMCHGGWYAVAHNIFDVGCKEDEDDETSYEDGADIMAADLGFNGHYLLTAWAYHNPLLWGNRSGGGMFTNIEAFDGAKSLLEIVNWWVRVCNRCHPDDEPLPEYT